MTQPTARHRIARIAKHSQRTGCKADPYAVGIRTFIERVTTMKEDNRTNSQIRECIRKNLINIRVKNGLTQTDEGIIVGRAKNSVSSWEQGLSLPDLSTLYRLALYYNKPLEWFYEDHTR